MGEDSVQDSLSDACIELLEIVNEGRCILQGQCGGESQIHYAMEFNDITHHVF